MIIVTGLSGNSDVITKVNNFEMYEELNGALRLSFTSFLHEENPGHTLIQNESIVEYEGYEFRVKQLRTTTLTKQVTAISTYFDNVDKRKYDTYGGTHTFDEFATYLFADTGWTFINDDITDSQLITNFGNDNVVRLNEVLVSAFSCERKIEPGNVVRYSTKIGPDNDEQYRYGHNIIALSESVDTTQMRTYIEGFGANDIHVTYTSPLADDPAIGIRHADPIYDDSFTDEALLLEHIKSQLQDYPESTVELDAVELQEKEIGERVWLIHERLGIEYQTRVVSKRSKVPKSQSTVVLGNTKPKTFTDALASQKVELDKNKKEYRSKIEQTNDRITLQVESIDTQFNEHTAKFEILDTQIASKVESTTYTSGISSANTYAETKANEAKAAAEAYALAKANLAQTTAEAYADGIVTAEEQARINDATAKLAEAKTHAETKASAAEQAAKTYSDGQLSPVITRVTNAESSITQLSSSIELKVSEEIYETDKLATDGSISSLGTRVTTAESTITQHAGLISSKVAQVDYNGNYIASLINQSATTISIQASKINLSGAVTISALATDTSNYLSGIDSTANTANSNANTATTKANDAYSLASTANSNANTANGYLDMWKKPNTTYIDGAYIASGTIQADRFYGNLFTVGNGVTSTRLELYTNDNSAHYIKSTQAAGFRVESTGSLSLQAGSGYPIYVNSQMQAFNGFYASGTSSFDNGLNVNGELKATYLKTSYGYLDSDSSLDVRVLSGSYFGVTLSGSQRLSVTYSQLLMQGTVKCTSLDTSSDVNLKKDITDYTESAVQKIVDTPIVSYRYKDESADARKTIGIIAQVAPDEVYSPGEEDDAVSIYPMVAMAWKAIQELQKQIDEMKGA